MINLGKFEDLNVLIIPNLGIIFEKDSINYNYPYSSDLFHQLDIFKNNDKNLYHQISLNNSKWALRGCYDFHDGYRRYNLFEFYLFLINNDYISNILTVKDILE